MFYLLCPVECLKASSPLTSICGTFAKWCNSYSSATENTPQLFRKNLQPLSRNASTDTQNILFLHGNARFRCSISQSRQQLSLLPLSGIRSILFASINEGRFMISLRLLLVSSSNIDSELSKYGSASKYPLLPYSLSSFPNIRKSFTASLPSTLPASTT